jgi:prophage DNA circulation protein
MLSLTNPIVAGGHNLCTEESSMKIRELQNATKVFLQNLEAMEANRRARKQNPLCWSPLPAGGIVGFDKWSHSFTTLSSSYNELTQKEKDEILKDGITNEIKKIFRDDAKTVSFICNKLNSKDGSGSINLERLDKLFAKVLQGTFKEKKEEGRIFPSTTWTVGESTFDKQKTLFDQQMADLDQKHKAIQQKQKALQQRIEDLSKLSSKEQERERYLIQQESESNLAEAARLISHISNLMKKS